MTDILTETSLADLEFSLVKADSSGLGIDAFGRSSISGSPVDPTEHIFFQLPSDGMYKLLIENTSAMNVEFGFALLSVAVPEPSTAVLSIVSLALLLRRSRRRGV